MKYLLISVCLLAGAASAQQNKSDRKNLAVLKKHIYFLADDKLEGRRTGTAGEKIAYEYLVKEFRKKGISPLGKEGYLQPFEVADGKKVTNASLLMNGKALKYPEDFFPFAWSANTRMAVVPSKLKMVDIGPWITENKGNPHFDLSSTLYDSAKAFQNNNNDLVVFLNSSGEKDDLQFDAKEKKQALSIPVIFIKKLDIPRLKAAGKEFDVNVVLDLRIEAATRTGHNVIGFIDNNSPRTVVIGAHYDHLGYGEDHNSLFTGSTPSIHNGADDNASGTAALLLLADMLKQSSLKNNNYLLVAFSGEELGLYGSKYFVEHSPVNISDINYMINMDMLGRLNDSTRGLTIGGYGTSPVWSSLVTTPHPFFKLKTDSSGSGPSDHTSFYRKDIPVLFFFTGTHQDYHKPTDDADKINFGGELEVIKYIYSIIEKADELGKFAFLKTKESATSGKSTFKVSLGIMPDYTFSGEGVLVDGVTEGRAAQRAGIKQGDILIQLGDYPFNDVQTYMQALNKFEKGQSTQVKLKRGDKEIVYEITF